MLLVMLFCVAFVAAAGALVLRDAKALVATSTFAPAADAYVSQSKPNTSFGADARMRVQESPIQRAYIRFNVTGLPRPVQRATLRLFGTSSSSVGFSVQPVANNTWSEATITYANAPVLDARVVASSGAFGSGQWIALDVTSLVAGNGTVTFGLTSKSPTQVQVRSKEGGASTAPQLVVEPIPDPTPANTSPPTISGIAEEGRTLTAAPGTWTGTEPITYTYHWRRCDNAGGNCADVPGATGTTYTLASADVGSTMRVSATGMNSAGSSTASSAQTAVVLPSPSPPVNTSPPTITGSPQEGSTLSAAPGAWSGSQPIGYAYQWLRCDGAGATCVAIADAIAQTYTLTGADAGSRVRVSVTAANTAGSATASSDPTAVVASSVPPTNTSPPTITGTPQEGQTLSAAPGAWSGTQPISYLYSWQRCDSAGIACIDIALADSQLYTLTGADVGSTLRIAVTAQNVAGTNTAWSDRTAVVLAAPVPPTNTSPPTITGPAQEGQTLTAAEGTWTGTPSFSYQWQRCSPDYAEGVRADSPAVYWRLGESSGTTATDASGNGRNGRYVGGVTLGLSGAVNGDSDRAVRFDGNDDNVIANPFNGFPATGLTAEFWMQSSNASKAAGVLSYATTVNDNTFEIRDQLGRLDVYRGLSMVATTVRPDDGVWHHIAVTWRSADGQVQVFRDGVLAFTGAVAPGTTIPQSGSLVLGQDQDSVGGGFDPTQAYLGLLDEVAIYPTVVSASRIQAHYAVSASACAAIGGAIAKTYRLVPADIGKRIRVVVTGTNAQGSAAATSSLTASVTDATPPSSPSLFRATSVGANSVTTAWDASTDNVGVTGYRMLRNGATADETTQTGYTFTGLECATAYTLGVEALDAAGNVSQRASLATSTGPCTADPVIAAAGDIACAPADLKTATTCHQLETSDLLVGRTLAAVLPLGDTQYTSGQLSYFQMSYEPTWGRVKAITRPAVGNHEYETLGAAGYFDYFNGAGAFTGRAGDRDKGYYSYDVGAWHLIALNGNCAEVGGCGAGSPQEVWLRNDLASHSNSCTLAYWHQPRYSSGVHGSSTVYQTFWQDLYGAGADLVLAGHDHMYERFAPMNATGSVDLVRGLREFVVGSGGYSHYAFTTIQPGSEVRDSATFGVLLLILRPTGYDWQFVPEAGKTFTDSGSTVCH